MKVDLLIVNYKTPQLLAKLLDTLWSDYEPNVYNIYIADNGSPDAASKIFMVNLHRELYYGSLPIEKVYLNENIGYSAAINQMAADSKAEILCAVNADTWFTTNHVKQVIQSFKDTPKMAVCGVKQMDDRKLIRHGGIFWDGTTNPVHRGWTEYDPGDFLYKDKVQCWTVSGSIYYVRRSVWDEMTNYPPYQEIFHGVPGAFLPTPMYFEETFCSVFAAALGYEVWYDGTVETAGHQWHASAPVGSNVHYFELSKRIYRDACVKLGFHNEFHDI